MRLLRKKESSLPVIVTTVYEYLRYLRASVKTLRPMAHHFQVKPFTSQMLTLALDKLGSIQIDHQKGLKILSANDDHVHLSICSQIALIEDVVAYLQDYIDRFGRDHHLPPVNMSLCLREALANAIIHGNLEIPSALKEESWGQFEALVQEREKLQAFADRDVWICCQLTTERITITIEDQGSGFDHGVPQHSIPQSTEIEGLPDVKEHDPLNTLTRTGRGLVFIQAFTDQVFWNAAGNCITMIKNFSNA